MDTIANNSAIITRIFGLSPLSYYRRKQPPLTASLPPQLAFSSSTLRRSSPQLHPREQRLFAMMATKAYAKVIHPYSVADRIEREVEVEASRMKEAIGVIPGLGEIIVDDTDMRWDEFGIEDGINCFTPNFFKGSTEQEVLNCISRYNDDPSIHGIVVDLPLPSYMNEQNILNAVRIEKDVNCLHSQNFGLLAMRDREPLFNPPIAMGCIELLHQNGLSVEGKRVVVIGRGYTAGMPIALLLQREAATVSVVHSKTSNPEEITRQADIIISTVGQANIVKGSWIKPGAVVIDIGIHEVEDWQLAGDVCFEEALKVVSAITTTSQIPYCLTRAMVLQNTLKSAQRMHNFELAKFRTKDAQF